MIVLNSLRLYHTRLTHHRFLDMAILTHNSNEHQSFSFINNGMDGDADNNGNMLTIDQSENGSLAAGIGINRIPPCNYQYVPSLAGVKLANRVIRPFVWDEPSSQWIPDLTPVLYQAETTVWNTQNAWLEYNGELAHYLTGNHGDVIDVEVVAKFKHPDDNAVFEVARRTVQVTIWDEIYTLRITGNNYEYFDALTGMEPKEVQELDFFKQFIKNNAVRLSLDGTVEYRIDRPSLATSFPLDVNGKHEPLANQLRESSDRQNKLGNVMLEFPRFNYKWQQERCQEGFDYTPQKACSKEYGDGECPDGYTWNSVNERCENEHGCPVGFTWNPATQQCERQHQTTVNHHAYPVKIEAGKHHVAIIMSDGTLWTAGDNSFYQLARSTSKPVMEVDANGDPIVTGTAFNPCPNYDLVQVGSGTGEANYGGGLFIDYTTHRVVDVSCGFEHTVFIVEHRTTKERKVYSCGSNVFGQLGRIDKPSSVREAVAEIPFASITGIKWHDGSNYNNDDNSLMLVNDEPVSNTVFNTNRFKIRHNECVSVECGSYHTHLIYPIGSIEYNVGDDEQIHHQVFENNQWRWATVLLNCGRNRHGELCRNYSSEGANALRAVILGGKYSRNETPEGLCITIQQPARLYPYHISSNVYHSALITTTDINPPQEPESVPLLADWAPGNCYTVGSNHYGQLGRVTENWYDDQLAMISDGIVERTVTGWGSSAFIDSGGNVSTCGANYYGQLGRQGSSGTHMVSNLAANNIQVKAFSMGDFHTLFTDLNDNLYTCGRAEHGVLLVDAQSGNETTSPISTGFKAITIGAGYSFSGFANETPFDNDPPCHEGQISIYEYYCAGNNERGILGRESEEAVLDKVTGIVTTNNAVTPLSIVMHESTCTYTEVDDGTYKGDLWVLPPLLPEGSVQYSFARVQIDHTWDTFHIWKSREVENIYTSLFPSILHTAGIPRSPMAFSHCVIDDVVTASIDESRSLARPSIARQSVTNLGKKFKVMPYEIVTMLRMIAMMINQNDDIQQFFGAGEIPDGTVRSPIFIEDIRLERNPAWDTVDANNNVVEERNFNVYILDRYSPTGGDQRVNTYMNMPNNLRYISEYGSSNVLNLLPGNWTATPTNSGVNMSPIQNTDTKLMSITMKNGFYLSQIIDTKEHHTDLPFYFVAYGKIVGQIMNVHSRYEPEEVVAVITEENAS